MNKLIASMVAGIGLLAMAGTAYAAPVTFVFQNPGSDTPTNSSNYTTTNRCKGIPVTNGDLCAIDNSLGFDYSKDGLTLNATANEGGWLLQDLAPTNSGLAVLSEGESNSDDQIQLENNESIRFEFGTLVSLLGIDFNAGADRNCANPGNEGPCGTFSLIVDGTTYSGLTAIDNMSFSGISGTVFEIVSTQLGAGFTIGSITANVPEPGTLALLGLGLIGIAARRRKHAQ